MAHQTCECDTSLNGKGKFTVAGTEDTRHFSQSTTNYSRGSADFLPSFDRRGSSPSSPHWPFVAGLSRPGEWHTTSALPPFPSPLSPLPVATLVPSPGRTPSPLQRRQRLPALTTCPSRVLPPSLSTVKTLSLAVRRRPFLRDDLLAHLAQTPCARPRHGLRLGFRHWLSLVVQKSDRFLCITRATGV